jgi:glycine betaine/proline transport system permease protein
MSGRDGRRTLPELPLGAWLEEAVMAARTHLGGGLELFSATLAHVLDAVYRILLLPHPYLSAALFALVGGLTTRRLVSVPVAAAGLLAVQSMRLWNETMQTLTIVLVAAAVAVAIGVPLGILSACHAWVRSVLRPVLDLMQTMPVFVYLLPAVFLFGIGVVPGLVATTVFSIPPAVRLTDLGIRQVDPEVVEAACAFGARPRQILRDVQLPLARQSIMAGINQVIMLALSMVVIAGMVGARGLGAVVVQAITQLDIGRGFEGGLAVVVLAVYLDRVTAPLGNRHGRSKRTVSHVHNRRSLAGLRWSRKQGGWTG